MSPGMQTSESQAGAPMAAGVALEAMRRRVRLSRLAVWTVIAAGPIALCIAIASTPTTVRAATEAKPTIVRTAAAADPGGYAQLFVSAWLRSSADNATTAQARLAQSLTPDVDLPTPAADAHSGPQSVTAVRSAQSGSGDWLVTVAAQYADGSVRYYTVPVAASRDGASFTVTGAPHSRQAARPSTPSVSPARSTQPCGHARQARPRPAVYARCPRCRQEPSEILVSPWNRGAGRGKPVCFRCVTHAQSGSWERGGLVRLLRSRRVAHPSRRGAGGERRATRGDRPAQS
nr:conjugal transfer protein [Streptomyces sp. MUSC 14]